MGALPGDAQAACDFSFSMSKSSPFFHRVSVNSCNLACQREARPGGHYAFGERALVKLLEGSGLYTGPGGRAFKQAFQIMVVILVQAANGRLFFAPLRLTFDELIFPAVAGFQPQSAVGPQLAL